MVHPSTTLAAVVVTHDRLDKLRVTIRSLLTEPVDQVIVVDNASTDGTREWLEDNVEHVILNDRNLYPGAACNQGWAYGLTLEPEHELLHRSDNDIEYLPGWYEHVIDMLGAWPEIALLGILNLHEDRDIDGRAETGIDPVPRVGGNVVMPARLFVDGLRWSEAPWANGQDEDGPMSWAARERGWVARLRRTVANNMAFGRAQDFPDYYRATAKVRGISDWEHSV